MDSSTVLVIAVAVYMFGEVCKLIGSFFVDQRLTKIERYLHKNGDFGHDTLHYCDDDENR